MYHRSPRLRLNADRVCVHLQALFNPDKLAGYTEVESIQSCVKACGGRLNQMYSMRAPDYPGKKGKEMIGIAAFKSNTGFKLGIPTKPKYIPDDLSYITELDQVGIRASPCRVGMNARAYTFD